MTKQDLIKCSALNEIDSYIKNRFDQGWLLENIKLGKDECNLSPDEYKEVQTNIEEFNNDFNRRYSYCKDRSIAVPNKEI